MSTTPTTRPTRRWRFPVLGAIAALLMASGVTALTYPSAASWISQYNQSKVVDSTMVRTEPQDDEYDREQLRLAHAYNDAVTSGALVGENQRIPTSQPGSTGELDYHKILVPRQGGDYMGRLQIPSIDLDLPVYHGATDEVLLRGLGHLEGTSLPVGGLGTRSVITGHRGMASATMFTNLDKVKVGDDLNVTVAGETLTYRVYDIAIVEPDDSEAIRAEAGRDLLTLVTCTPLGINTQRILVNAERIAPTPEDALEAASRGPVIPRFPWWIVILGATLIGVVVFIWRSGYPPRPRRGKRTDGAASEVDATVGREPARGDEPDASDEAAGDGTDARNQAVAGEAHAAVAATDADGGTIESTES